MLAFATLRQPLLALLGPREMFDLSPQSGPSGRDMRNVISSRLTRADIDRIEMPQRSEPPDLTVADALALCCHALPG